LKYQKIIVAFFLILITVFMIDYVIVISTFVYAGIIVVCAGFLAFGSINIKSGFYCQAICSAEIEKKVIALSFDDGPEITITPGILEILNCHDIKAVFFCIGNKAEKNPDLIKKINSEGHIIGSHTWSHGLLFDLLSSGKMVIELKKTEALLEKILNKKIRMFRPPYGVTNPPLARAIREMDYYIIGWSLRSNDTKIRDEEKLLERLKKRLRPGDIILFHDTKGNTLNVLDRFIRYAKAMNYSFERPDRLLGIEAYE
jgi:peptidoglycan-N-acetylglucosamine deacetylase